MGKFRLSDKEFLSVLRANAGLYSRTMRAIQNQYGIEYSRQAVRQRAEKFPEELADIREQNKDVAEEGLHSLMRSSDERVKLKACTDFLKYQAKDRGYVEKQIVDHNIMNISERTVFSLKTKGNDEEKGDK